MLIRDATPADFADILTLNAAYVAVLSPMDRRRLEQLHRQAALHRVIEQEGQVAAFLLAMREGTDYDSPNYRWFASRYPRFLYVDRVAVAGDRQAQGAGSWLYRDVHAFARSRGVPQITCEFDIEPLNPASQRFHARQGFREVGRQTLSGAKVVSMQALDVANGDWSLVGRLLPSTLAGTTSGT